MAGDRDVPQLRAMHNWKRIRLELTRTADFPTGSVSRGYLLRLPLDDTDRIDPLAVADKPHLATVQRYWSSEPDEVGGLVHTEDGWALRCNGNPDRMLQVGNKPILLGQQLSVTDADGTTHPFTVASIR